MTETTHEKPAEVEKTAQAKTAEEEDMDELKKLAPKRRPSKKDVEKGNDEKDEESSARQEDEYGKKRKESAKKFFRGKKHRRESSSSKLFIGDHMGVSDSPEVESILSSFTPREEFYFADHCTRLANRNHMEDCCIMVSTHFLFIMNNRLQHLLTDGPIPISKIIKIGTSQETDNAVVLFLPEFNSELIMTSFKIELMDILIERYKSITDKDIQVVFSNIIEFEVNETTIFEFDFVRANDGVRMTLFIKAKPELPKPK
jgi:hypothetical protein